MRRTKCPIQLNGRNAGKENVHQQLSGLFRLMLNLHGPVTRLQELLDAAVVEMRNRCAVIRLSQAVGNWGVSTLESPVTGKVELRCHELVVFLHVHRLSTPCSIMAKCSTDSLGLHRSVAGAADRRPIGAEEPFQQLQQPIRAARQLFAPTGSVVCILHTSFVCMIGLCWQSGAVLSI